VVIESRLADGHHTRVLCQLTQWRKHVFLGFFNVSGMNTNGRVNSRILFRKINRPLAAFQRRSNSDDARYSSFDRAAKHGVQIVREIGIIEVRVSLYKHCGLWNAESFQ
jgi:hypothetical protein